MVYKNLKQKSIFLDLFPFWIKLNNKKVIIEINEFDDSHSIKTEIFDNSELVELSD